MLSRDFLASDYAGDKVRSPLLMRLAERGSRYITNR